MEQFFVELFQNNPDAFKYWGLLIIFATTFIESLPLLGALLPGQILVIFAGFLAKAGVFGFWSAFGVVSLGAILGDLAGFLLGRKYGGWLMQKRIWKLERKHFEATARLVEENSIKSIFIGRLHSFTRTLMPFAAGMSQMSAKKFIIVDIITATIWALLSLSVGYVFGKSFDLATSFVGKFILFATIGALALIIAIYQMKKRGRKIAWMDAGLLGISVGAFYLFAVIAQSFESGRLFLIMDTRIEAFALSHQTEWLRSIALFFTNLGGPLALSALMAVFVLLLLYKKRWRDAVFTLSTLGASVIFVSITKALFERERPVPGLLGEYGPSFPSGHAMMAVVSAIVLYYVGLRKIKSDMWRGIISFLVFGSAFAIGFSRVYLDVHWASDVLGGFFAGVFFATFAIIVLRFVTSLVKKYKRKSELPNIP